jgi:hypothetical protein
MVYIADGSAYWSAVCWDDATVLIGLALERGTASTRQHV